MKTIKSYLEGSNYIKSQSWGMFTNLEFTQSLPTCTLISFSLIYAIIQNSEKK